MSISYNNLFKMMDKKHIKKQDLRDKVGLSPATVAKLSKNENVSMDVVVRLCEYFNCGIDKVVEIVEDKGEI